MLVFDLETQYLADEVGGWNHIRAMRLSVGVIYDPTSDTYCSYEEGEVERLIEALCAAERVIGYNLYRFDYEVLRGYRATLNDPPTVDMLQHLYRTLGWRPKLDDLAAATLGEHKHGDGLDAVRWFRAGQLDKVRSYCQRDVEITWRVYDFGRRNGYVQVMDRSRRPRRIAVAW